MRLFSEVSLIFLQKHTHTHTDTHTHTLKPVSFIFAHKSKVFFLYQKNHRRKVNSFQPVDSFRSSSVATATATAAAAFKSTSQEWEDNLSFFYLAFLFLFFCSFSALFRYSLYFRFSFVVDRRHNSTVAAAPCWCSTSRRATRSSVALPICCVYLSATSWTDRDLDARCSTSSGTCGLGLPLLVAPAIRYCLVS